jgi:hypothetical protein
MLQKADEQHEAQASRLPPFAYFGIIRLDQCHQFDAESHYLYDIQNLLPAARPPRILLNTQLTYASYLAHRVLASPTGLCKFNTGDEHDQGLPRYFVISSSRITYPVFLQIFLLAFQFPTPKS